MLTETMNIILNVCQFVKYRAVPVSSLTSIYVILSTSPDKKIMF